jgi:hypothetical protein
LVEPDQPKVSTSFASQQHPQDRSSLAGASHFDRFHLPDSTASLIGHPLAGGAMDSRFLVRSWEIKKKIDRSVDTQFLERFGSLRTYPRKVLDVSGDLDRGIGSRARRGGSIHLACPVWGDQRKIPRRFFCFAHPLPPKGLGDSLWTN